MARRALGPATLAVLQAVQRSHAGEDLLVACSGGADSLALAAAVARLAARGRFAARAVVIDHNLQQDSAVHSRSVLDQLNTLGLPGQVIPVEVRTDGAGPEAAARAARYQALSASLKPAERCYLGHTLDDQAETVLLGLARGSGLRSLAAMAPSRDGFVRPLLGLRRAITRQSCQEQNLTWWDDPHNTSERFTRVRVRHIVLPVLEAELGPGIAEALARTAELAREDADALDGLAAAVGIPDELPCAVLAELPPAVRNRVLRSWLLAGGASEVAHRHVVAVAALVDDWHGQQWVDVPGLRAARREAALVVLPPAAAPARR